MKDRFTIKCDTADNWDKAVNFIPLKGEPIIYLDSQNSAKMKIGDGQTKVSDLEFWGVRDSFVEDGLLTL